jgi:hypothetical protein
MWMYSGPNCPDHSFSTDLDNSEIDIWIRRILALEDHQSSDPSPIPLREWVIIPWVNLLNLCPTFALPNACCVYAQGLGCVCSEPRGVTMPKDVARQETNRADNERHHAWNQRRRVRSTSQAVARAQGEETLSKLGSLGADEEEGEDEE